MNPNKDTALFCKMIRQRSFQNRRAIACFGNQLANFMSPAFSILRQELDSMVRVIYLLSVTDRNERRRLIQATLEGTKWQVYAPGGKGRLVTDRDMVELTQQLHGWTRSVYKFGCSFIHLSDFHNHLSSNPFHNLSDAEKSDIISHMRHYHMWGKTVLPSMEELALYIPSVFNKITGNLKCYIEDLEQGKDLDQKDDE